MSIDWTKPIQCIRTCVLGNVEIFPARVLCTDRYYSNEDDSINIVLLVNYGAYESVWACNKNGILNSIMYILNVENTPKNIKPTITPPNNFKYYIEFEGISDVWNFDTLEQMKAVIENFKSSTLKFKAFKISEI